MFNHLCDEKKLILLISLFENLEFKTDYEIKNIIDLLKNILIKLNQDYSKTITNFSKYKDLLLISSKYLELKEVEKKRFIIELLFDIYETNFEDDSINKYIVNDTIRMYKSGK